MPWLAIATNKWTWIAIAFGILSAYAAVQHIGWEASKAEYAQFRADTERLAAEAKVKNAQIAAQQAQAAQEVVSDLQTRLDRANARYASLRARTDSSAVPALSSAASVLSSCPAGQPDPAARRMDEIEAEVNRVLEIGDKEIAKYFSLWQLNKKNAAATPE